MVLRVCIMLVTAGWFLGSFILPATVGGYSTPPEVTVVVVAVIAAMVGAYPHLQEPHKEELDLTQYLTDEDREWLKQYGGEP